ncbi:MAG: bacteriohemerythrin [Nitrospinae bacterium]|nr:bacteriohemerythrin [Nitrospinota bacterium]
MALKRYLKSAILVAVVALGLLSAPAIAASDDGLERAYASISPEPVSLADAEVRALLTTDWLASQKKGAASGGLSDQMDSGSRGSGTEGYSRIFWILQILVAVLIVTPLLFTFGAAARKLSINLKLYNSHGSLLLLAMILGASGYLYISRLTGVSDLNWRLLELNAMASQLNAAQTGFLLYGVKDPEFGARQSEKARTLLQEFDRDFNAIYETGLLEEEETRLLDRVRGALGAYKTRYDSLTGDSGTLEAVKKEIDGQTSLLAVELQKAASTIGAGGVEGRALSEVRVLFGDIQKRYEKYLAANDLASVQDMEKRFGYLMAFVKQLRQAVGDTKQANDLVEGFELYAARLEQVVRAVAVIERDTSAMSETILEMTDATSAASENLAGRAEGLFSEANLASTIMIIMAIFVGIVPTVLVTRSITGPLNEVVDMLKEMGIGKLDRRMNMNTEDEVGQMARALDEFADNLQFEVVGALQRLAEGDLTFDAKQRGKDDVVIGALARVKTDLNGLISEINRAGDIIASRAKMVSDSAHNLSDGSASQASALEQITASTQHIAEQVNQNAKNAGDASSLAEQSRLVAVEGNSRMKEMVSAMSAINDSSQNISKIIKVIDEIAFQTNLLALNAAVEAARAGRHGKGFAVVAEEVRNLAGRSARAAQETAALIQGSVEKVQNGADIADRTASALEEIVQSFTKVSGLIGQIARANTDQATGISEIRKGLSEIDHITQQNASISEQSASASAALSGEATNLKEMLSRFALSDDGGPVPSKALPPATKPVAAPRASAPAAKGAPRRAAAPAPVAPKRGPVADFIKWDANVYGTGVAEMDQQHQKLFQLVNELHADIKAGGAPGSVDKILGSLVEYAQKHLSDEEAFMQKIGFNEFPPHKGIHEDLLRKVGKFLESQGKGEGPSLYQLLGFLRDWLDNHIRKEDTKYGHFFRRHGGGNGSAQQAKAAAENAGLDDDFGSF